MANYLITGATGYIGSMLTKHILQQAKQGASKNEVAVIVRNVERAREILPSDVQILQADVIDNIAMSQVGIDVCDYVIHCAAPTKSAYMVSHPVETIQSIVNGTQNVLELARRCGAKSIVYLSSVEVYGKMNCCDSGRITEENLGEINVFNERSCYPLGKRMAEHICYTYFKEYGVPVKIARLAQTFGKGILREETRVFAQFARAVKFNEDIVLHTKGDSIGNYCDIDDVLWAILILLEKGENGEAYNVVNEENTMTIREMAEMVARKIGNGKISIQYDIPEENVYGYASASNVKMSSQKLRDLGWLPKKNLEIMYQDMMNDL